MTTLEEAFSRAGIPFLEHCRLSDFSTFRIGGIADLAAFPQTAEALIRTIELCKSQNIPVTVLGNGSNVLFSDDGLRGAVIFTGKIDQIVPEPDGFYAGCGVLLPALSKKAATCGFSGLEFAAGIPGTVGGAVCMNAGAHGGELSGVVTKTDFYDMETGCRGEFSGREHRFGYRTGIYAVQPSKIVLGAHFALAKEDPEKIRARMAELLALRRASQPVGKPSAGSIFKRPPGTSAAELIDRCGLKGLSVGDAAVSEKHAGFIINRGQATAKEVLALIRMVQETVLQKTGIFLEPEIRILGEI